MNSPSRSKRMDQAKTQADAKDSKKNVALSKVKAQDDWRQTHARQIDRIDKDLAPVRDFVKKYGKRTPKWFEEDEKRREEMKKALQRLGRKMIKTHQEMQKVQKEIRQPIKPDLPRTIPINSMDFSLILPAMLILLAWFTALDKLRKKK